MTSRALSPSSGLTSPRGTTGQAGLASSGRGGNHLGAPSILRPPRVTARMDREGVPRFELSVTPPRPRPLMGAARAVGDQAGHARRRLLSVVSAVVACAVDVLGGGAPRVVKWSFLPRAGPVRQRGTRPRLVHRERRGARHAVQGGYEIGRGTRCGAVQVSSVCAQCGGVVAARRGGLAGSANCGWAWLWRVGRRPGGLGSPGVWFYRACAGPCGSWGAGARGSGWRTVRRRCHKSRDYLGPDFGGCRRRARLGVGRGPGKFRWAEFVRASL